MKFEIQGYVLEGGGVCPEQYDVFKDGEKVGYIRLRGGWLTADVPDAGEAEVFRYSFDDMWKGDFDEPERIPWLTAALKSIHNYLHRRDVQNPIDPQKWMENISPERGGA